MLRSDLNSSYFLTARPMSWVIYTAVPSFRCTIFWSSPSAGGRGEAGRPRQVGRPAPAPGPTGRRGISAESEVPEEGGRGLRVAQGGRPAGPEPGGPALEDSATLGGR